MSHPTDFQGSITEAVRASIIKAIPDAVVEVEGGGGHFTIDVVSASFEGQRLLAKQRMVYGAITHLMAGDRPPVHAVDRLTTRTPE